MKNLTIALSLISTLILLSFIQISYTQPNTSSNEAIDISTVTYSRTGCSTTTNPSCFNNRCYGCIRNGYYFLSNSSCSSRNTPLRSGVTVLNTTQECISLSYTSVNNTQLAFTYPTATESIHNVEIYYLDELELCPGCSANLLFYNRLDKNAFVELEYDLNVNTNFNYQ